MTKYFSSLLLFCVFAISAQAKPIATYRMDSLVLLSDVVVYCDEKDVRLKEVDHGNWKETEVIVKCKVLQSFKGRVAPDAELTVWYDSLFRRNYRDDAMMEQSATKVPPGKALSFLKKDDYGSYAVVDSKLVQNGKVFEFRQIANPGPLGIVPMLPENLKLAEGQRYGEKELLKDFAIALKNSVFLKQPVMGK